LSRYKTIKMRFRQLKIKFCEFHLIPEIYIDKTFVHRQVRAVFIILGFFKFKIELKTTKE